MMVPRTSLGVILVADISNHYGF